MKKSASALALSLSLSFQAPAQGEIVDVFIATGQSNAYWPPTMDLSAGTYQFGHGVKDALVASGLFSNPTVVIAGVPGQEIAAWHNDVGPTGLYNQEFFDTTNVSTGLLEAQFNAIIANGDTPRFRGLFWFQGEADGSNATEAQYAGRWNGLLSQLASDVGSSDFNFVMNKVGNSGTLINDTLTTITNADPRGVLFDTQVPPYRTNPADIHGYDHYAVGQANAQLFIDTFVNPVDIFIVAGQSNANGQGLVSNLTAQQAGPHNALYFCSWHQFANTAEPSFGSPQFFSGWFTETVAGETRSAGNVTTTYGSSPWFGPEVGFAARANEIDLTDNPIAILKYAVDGSALTATANMSDWDLNATAPGDGDCWRGFQAALAAAVTGLQNDGYTPNFKGMVWWQGENGTNAADLNAFIAAVRSHLANNYGLQNSSSFPVVITGNDFWGAGLETGVADLDPHVGFIDSVDYGQTGGYTNVHPGSGQGGNSTDVTGNGINDMWDFGVAYADEMALVIAGGNGGGGNGSTWDGEAGDGLWTSPTNWSGDAVPTSTDDVLVGLSATVTAATSDFATLEIESGASVTLDASGEFLASKTVDIDGTLNLGGVFRPSGCTLNLSGSLGSDISWLDVKGGTTINFTDGASFGNAGMSFELRDAPTFGFELSATGFAPIAAGGLFNATTGWSAVTFNIDVSNYEISNGTSVVLMDFASDFGGAFDPTVNLIAGGSGLTGNLSFDTATDQLIVTFNGGPAPVTWDGEGVDGLWVTAANWSDDTLPAPNDTIGIGGGATVSTEGISALHGANQLPNGATVNLTGNSTLTDGTDAVLRLNGSTLNVSAGSTLTGGFWDLNNGSLNFEDGAIATMANWEQKGTNAFQFTLGASGFTTLMPGSLLISGGAANIANATYTVDMAAYTGPANAVITLVDFSTDTAGLDDATFQGAGGLNVLNPGSYTASIQWNDAADAIALVVGEAGLAWDGEAADGLWSTSTNWSNDMLPGAGSTVSIANGDTVDWNSAVSGQFFPGGITINLSGASTLTEGTVIRLNGATINVDSTSGLSGGFWDLQNATLSFEDGAIAAMSNWEQKGTNVFNFELGETGFTALTPGTLRIGGGATIADATYNVDMTNYTGGAGIITLVDFGSDAASMDDATFQGAGGLNVLNVPSGLSAALQWNDTTEAIELVVTAAGGLPNIIDIAVDGSGNVVLTLDGSEAGLTAQQSDDLTMGSFSDVASTPGANTLTIDAVNVDPNLDGKDFYRVRN